MRRRETSNRIKMREVYGVEVKSLRDSLIVSGIVGEQSVSRQAVDRSNTAQYQPTSTTTTPMDRLTIDHSLSCSDCGADLVESGILGVDPQSRSQLQPIRNLSGSDTVHILATDDSPRISTSARRCKTRFPLQLDFVSPGVTSEAPLATSPLRLRGGGSMQHVPNLGTQPSVSRSASTSASVSSEHDAVEQANGDSTTSSSSYDMNSYQAFLASGGIAQQQHQVTVSVPTQSSSSTQSVQSSTHLGDGVGGIPANGGNPYQPVPFMTHQTLTTGYTVSRGPGVPYQYPQHVETHSRHPQQTARAYSVSDSATSSTSYNEYQQTTNGGDGASAGGGSKGKGKAVEDDSAVVLSQDAEAAGNENTGRTKRHRRTTSSVSRKTDDSASYPTEFTAQLLTGLSKRPAPQKMTTLTTSGKKQNLPPSAYPHLRPGDTVTDPNTPHIHGCPYCNKVYRGQHARSICRRHQMSKHGIELEVQVKKSRWDNNPNRPATEEEKHQRTLESKRRWAAKDRKRRRCTKLGIPYVSSSDEDASGSDDDESMYNASAGPSGDHLAVSKPSRSDRSRSRSGSASQTPEVAQEAGALGAGATAKSKGKPPRRGSSALQHVAYPEDEDDNPAQAVPARRAAKKRADSAKQTADTASNRNMSRTNSKTGATQDEPFTSVPLNPSVVVKTEEAPSTRRRTTSARRVADRPPEYAAAQTPLAPGYAPGGIVPNVQSVQRQVAMVPSQPHPPPGIMYQAPIGEQPVFMNIPEGARVYAVQYRDDPRTGYRVVSAPQPVQFFIPTPEPGNIPLRPNSAPPEDAMARTTAVIMPPNAISPVLVNAEVHGSLAPPVMLRPEPMRRVSSLSQFPAPIPSSDADVFSVQQAPLVGAMPAAASGSRLIKAAIRRSSDDGPETEASKKKGSQDSDSNEEAAEILLAFSNSPARSVTTSSRKHARHQSMDTALSNVGEIGSSSSELSILAGSSRLQDITTGLQKSTTTPGGDVSDGEDEATPMATRTRPVKPPPIRPASEETPFQRTNLWPARPAATNAKPTEDDPFRVPAMIKTEQAEGSRTPEELAPSAYIMAPPPRPARASAMAFRQPKDVIPSSSNNPGLSSPPPPESANKSTGPTSQASVPRTGTTPYVGGTRHAFATPARQDWVASSPALGHPFSSPSGLDLTHKLGLAAEMSTVPDSPSWLDMVRATPDAKGKRNRTESIDGETGAEAVDDTPGKRVRL